MKILPMDPANKWPLLAALFGAAIGAWNGQFVWALIAALGFPALAYVAQNLIGIFDRTNSAENLTTVAQANRLVSSSPEKGPDWLEQWEDDMRYSPAYQGTPGNIWNGPKLTSDN